MANNVTLSQSAYQQLYNKIDRLEKLVIQLLIQLPAQSISDVKGVAESAPPYGSNEWWDWSDKQALRDVKLGRYTTLKNTQELQTFLDNLK